MELLIYAKDGKIKAISFDEAWECGEKLLAEGWEHTHTINPATFLQFIHNECKNDDALFYIQSLGFKDF